MAVQHMRGTGALRGTERGENGRVPYPLPRQPPLSLSCRDCTSAPGPCFLNAFLYYQVPGTALSSYSWILCYPRFLPFLPSALTPGTEQTTLLSLSAGYPPRFRGEEPELRGAIQEMEARGYCGDLGRTGLIFTRPRSSGVLSQGKQQTPPTSYLIGTTEYEVRSTEYYT